MVQTKQSISKFSQKSYYAIQFSIFPGKTAMFKPSIIFLNFLKNDITPFGSQFSMKRQHGSNRVVHL